MPKTLAPDLAAAMATTSWSGRVVAAGGRAVDGTSIAVLRIAVGAVAALSAARMAWRGWVDSLLVAPEHHLRHPGLEWVPVPPAAGIWALVAVVFVAGVLLAIGWRTRATAAATLVAFAWIELIESTLYLNHYWFLTLALALMVVLPVGAAWSLDARPMGERTVPAVAIWLLRAQIGVVYVFAGVAKLHGDWLVHGLPLGLWLPARADLALVGPLLERPSTALVLSWAGAIFDCTIVAFLCWRRTRFVAWLVVVAFHAVTWVLFPVIGVFPLLMVAATTVFFDPDWPRRLLARRRGGRGGAAREAAGAGGLADLDGAVRPDPGGAAGLGSAPARRARWVVAAVVVWAMVQVALPLRHLLYEGDHRWSGEGLRHGWNVMLVEKAGDVTFRVHDPATGATWRTDARELYTEQQWRVLSVEPELIRQAAHQLAAEELERRGRRVEVRVDAWMSLNGRPAAPLIDPDVDLAAEPWRLGHQRWILPAPTDPPR